MTLNDQGWRLKFSRKMLYVETLAKNCLAAQVQTLPIRPGNWLGRIIIKKTFKLG